MTGTRKPYTLVLDGELIGFYETQQAAENAVVARSAFRKKTRGADYEPHYKITYEGTRN